MSNRGESWVHGNSAAVQFPGGANLTSGGTAGHLMSHAESIAWSDVVGLRQGPGSMFRGQRGSNWFHFSIPTPTVVPRPEAGAHQRIVVDRVSVRWGADTNVFLTRVMAFDGTALLHAVPDFQQLFGDHRDQFEEGLNSWAWGGSPVSRGVGISVEITFNSEGIVRFAAAGIHYRLA